MKGSLLQRVFHFRTLREITHNSIYRIAELQLTNSKYESKLGGSGSDSEMLSLCWEIEELKTLIEEIRKIRPNVHHMIDRIQAPSINFIQENIPRHLGNIREKLASIVKGVFRFKRSVATHMFVVMISSELRNKKPYALPIQCLPYAGLKEKDVRRIVTDVVKEMKSRKMKVRGKELPYKKCVLADVFILLYIGFLSNGEFNYLRTKGYTRPNSDRS